VTEALFVSPASLLGLLPVYVTAARAGVATIARAAMSIIAHINMATHIHTDRRCSHGSSTSEESLKTAPRLTAPAQSRQPGLRYPYDLFHTPYVSLFFQITEPLYVTARIPHPLKSGEMRNPDM